VTFSGSVRYRIVRRLGAGGMGVVYEAYDRERRRRVALKTLSFDDPGAVYRLKKEFRTLADVAHPNLISFYELVREGDTWFITMELIEGETFLSYVRPGRDEQIPSAAGAGAHGILDLELLRSALGQLADGLHHLHEAGKWHRDLKPGNVMVTTEGRVVLLDFGLSAERHPEGPPSVGTGAMGTAIYMAPEQMESGISTPASDWYGVGVMLYESLTGKPPFSGPTMAGIWRKTSEDPLPPEEMVPDVPADLARLCRELLNRDPEGRPSGREVLNRLGMTEDETAASSTPRRRAPTVKGREPHLDVLREAFALSRTGQAVSVYTHGVSGIGKTTLVEHFIERLRGEQEVVVLSGRCYPRESMPYKAIDGVVDSLTRYLHTLSEERLREVLPDEILFLARIFPVLMQAGEDLDYIYPRPDVPDAIELRKRAFSALREMLRTIGEAVPLVLTIDDLQWADADSIALLEDLMRPGSAPPLLLICCFRSEAIDAHPFLSDLLKRGDSDRCRNLPVGRLDTETATELAGLLLEGKAADTLVRSVVEEADGSPFVLEQLARHLRESEEAEAGRATLAVMLDAQIRRSPPGARSLLQTLAVAQHPVDFDVAHAAAGIAGDPRALITPLEIGHLVRSSPDADRIEVYHDRIRETIAAELDDDAKRRIHLRIAQAMRRRGIEDPEALFEHFLGADRTNQAAEQALKAANHAMEALAFDRAARFYRRAIELLPPATVRDQELQARLAEALANAARPVDSADAYLLASEGREAVVALEMKRRAAEQLLFGGHCDRGLEVVRDLLRTAGLKMAPSRNRALVGIMRRLFRLRVRGLRFKERPLAEVPATDLLRIDVCWGVAVGLLLVDSIIAFDFATRHSLMALKAGEPVRVSRGLSLLSGFIASAGGRSKARTDELIEAAGVLAEKVGGPREVALAALSAGGAALLCGEYRRGVDLLLGAEQLLRRRCTGVMWELTTCQSFLLSCLIYLGELSEVSRRLPLMVNDALERGNLLAATEARTRANFGWLAIGEVDRAQWELDEALATWSSRGFHRQHYNALISQANIALYLGDAESAWRRVEKQWTPLRKSLLLRIQVLRTESNFLRARCALAAAAEGHETKRLLRVAGRHAARIESERMPWIDPFAALIRAGARALSGAPDRAREDLVRAANGFDRAEMKLYAAASRRRLGEMTGGSEGESLVTEADETMKGLMVRRPDRLTDVLAPGFPAG